MAYFIKWSVCHNLLYLNQCNPARLCLLLANLPAGCLLLSYLLEFSEFLDVLTSVDYLWNHFQDYYDVRSCCEPKLLFNKTRLVAMSSLFFCVRLFMTH